MGIAQMAAFECTGHLELRQQYQHGDVYKIIGHANRAMLVVSTDDCTIDFLVEMLSGAILAKRKGIYGHMHPDIAVRFPDLYEQAIVVLSDDLESIVVYLDPATAA